MKNNFARLAAYLSFICRRERLTSSVWIVCLAGLAAVFASLYPSLLSTAEEMTQMALTMNNPAMVAMMGNVYGLENLSPASMMAQECLVWFLIASAIMNIFLINRHTRADEELGRLEMLRALPVGRLTCGLAAIKFAFLVNLIASLLITALLLWLNIDGTTIAGAFAYGFAVGAAGFVFAGLTLLLAQLLSTAHGVSGAGMALLGLFYIMRALGDVNGNILSDISPLGLALKTEAFFSNAAAPLAILLAEGVFLSGCALAVSAYRDHGAGIIPAKKGRANASRFLRGPFGLAARLSKSTVIGWSAALFILGVSYGSVCSDIDGFVKNNEMMRNLLGAEGGNLLLDNYMALIYAIMSVVAGIPAVITVMKIHGEEKRGRLEQVFAHAVPRFRLYGGFIAAAAIGSVIIQLLLSLGIALSSGGQLDILTLIKTGFLYLPAIWAMAGLGVLLIGILPKLTALIWAMFGYTFIVMYMGKIMNLPKWTARITPFGNIPQLPVEEFTAIPLIILTAVAFALAALGLMRYKNRDIS